MTVERYIIGELEREVRGEELLAPEQLAEALETRALQMQVAAAIGGIRGKTAAELEEVTIGELGALQPKEKEEAERFGTEELIRGLERAEQVPGEQPTILAAAMLVKARQIRALLEGATVAQAG